ncbi:PepSY-like domain-containing protein [Flavimarina sp. Hel_I_48]|uniref:PepSY-like domain-containing protein n=1 Tax=Flavimarina sp. Hel_I_48 TaxID=1392488 RepID=UPI00068B1533|nr:PepSY-like domain-containing protein [Flavimarina sp. Hel_I_48]
MKMLRFLGILLFSSSLFAGTIKKDAPKVVRDAFAKKFPEAKSVKWDKESQNEWEAEFKMDGMEYSANFNNYGVWKETEHEVRQADVPHEVMASLKNEFPGYKIRESEISETSEGMVYEFEVKKGGSEIEVALDSHGKVVNKKENDGEGED